MLTNESVLISAPSMSIQIVKKKAPNTVRKLIEAIRERYKLKDSNIHECYERLNEVQKNFLKKNVFAIPSATSK